MSDLMDFLYRAQAADADEQAAYQAGAQKKQDINMLRIALIRMLDLYIELDDAAWLQKLRSGGFTIEEAKDAVNKAAKVREALSILRLTKGV